MPLQLEIVSDHKDLLGDDCARLFRDAGGTIGRALENDWILPDPDRYISGKHATIDFQSGAYYLADVSTNGVYINDDEEPLGNGNPRRLFHGDRLRMGDFEFVVSLDEGEGLEMPPPEPMTVVPDHIEQLVDEDSLKSGIQLLDEEAITGDDEFQAALFGGPATKSAPVAAVDSIAPAPVDNQPNPFAPPPTNEQVEDANTGNLLDAFFQGLGMDRDDLHASTDLLEVMRNAGEVLREFVAGSSDLLESRSAVKSMFRLDQTTVLPRHNNPLKLAENSQDATMQLLVGKEGEYLAPVDAVREVFRDLRYHNDAVLEAMSSAYQDFADRFDPDELQQNFDQTLDGKPLLRKMNQLKYWQLYCDLYPIMTQQGSGQLPHQFSEEFVRAYEKHIADFKRNERNLGVTNAHKNNVVAPASNDEELQDQTESASYADQF